MHECNDIFGSCDPNVNMYECHDLLRSGDPDVNVHDVMMYYDHANG